MPRPIVAIVGRPNVGKSTLFNRIIGEKKAIVLDTPGVTRDRNYGDAHWAGVEFTLIDTGGFEPEAETGVLASMRRQAMLAIDQADVVIFLVDGRDGLLAADEEVVRMLQRQTERVVFAVNKIDGPHQDGDVAEFYSLGVERVFPVAAEHGRGVNRLLDAVLALMPDEVRGGSDDEDEDEESPITRVAIVGRPNVGKSTLCNRLLGDERVIVDDQAGTTRDAIDIPLTIGEQQYLLIDTAGLRRSRGIDRKSSEGYSVVRTLRAMERCHVAVLIIDGTEGLTDQDARIAGLANEKGRALVLAVNKWDAVEKDQKTAGKFREEVARRLPFVNYAPVVFTAGLTGLRLHKLVEAIDLVRQSHLFRAGTGPLNRWLEEATRKHQPPMNRNHRVRLYYATQVRVAPPTIVISTNDPTGVHFSYQRFLVNQFREAFEIQGTPVRLVFKGKKNPFVDEA